MKQNKDFLSFQKWFKFYQDKLGLNQYQVYFKHQPLGDDKFATITVDQEGVVATVCLNSKLAEKDKPYKDIKRSAKHETIHLLTSRLDSRARDRYGREKEIDEAEEELVRRIENLVLV